MFMGITIPNPAIPELEIVAWGIPDGRHWLGPQKLIIKITDKLFYGEPLGEVWGEYLLTLLFWDPICETGWSLSSTVDTTPL
jgi:hypothetical protein